MDGEIIDTLLGLLDQGIPVDLPAKVFRLAAYLLQRLVDRHRTYRHRRIAQDPLPRLMDVLPRRQIHNGIRPPATGPYRFFYLILNTRADRRIPDIGVDLHQEITSNDHRL